MAKSGKKLIPVPPLPGPLPNPTRPVRIPPPTLPPPEKVT